MKFISKARIEFTIDGKSVFSNQLCFLGPKGFEVCKATSELYDRNIDPRHEYTLLYDKFGKVVELNIKKN